MSKPKRDDDGKWLAGESGNPNGRPTLLVDSEEAIMQIRGLAGIQCTMKEAGGVFGVGEAAFSVFLKANEKAREAWVYGQETGRASLRRRQFKMAETSATMQIWLGKQWLEQTDKHEQHVTVNSAAEMTDAQLIARIRQLEAAVRPYLDAAGTGNASNGSEAPARHGSAVAVLP